MQWLRHRFLLWGQNLIEKGNCWPLAPLSFFWGFIVFLRNVVFSLKTPKKVGCVVVSVGNVEVGGTGKTPLVLALAKRLSHRKVAILSRGYGAMPDEALMMKKRLPRARIYVGKNRMALAELAVSEGAQVIILDDGFQHRKVHRDFDLVLASAAKGHYLPWGRFRDSPKRLKKADVLFSWGETPSTITLCSKICRIIDGRGHELSTLQGKKIAMYCGIARPERFKKTLNRLGAKIEEEKILADHEPAQLSDLKTLAEKYEIVVTTEKDFVKLPQGHGLPIYYLEMEAEVLSGQKEWEELIEKIDQRIYTTTAHE